MKKFQEKLEEIAKIRMTNNERDLLRLNIIKFINNHSVEITKKSKYWFKSPYAFHVFKVTGVVFASFVILIVGGGSISAKANMALPGDNLWKLKVNTIEEVRGAFITSSKAKLIYNQARVAERIEELKTLAENGEITAEKTAEIEKVLDTHIAEIDKVAKELKEENPLEFQKATEEMTPLIEQHKNDLNDLKVISEKEISAGQKIEQNIIDVNKANELLKTTTTVDIKTQEVKIEDKAPIPILEKAPTLEKATSSLETSKAVDGIIAKIEKETVSIKAIGETVQVKSSSQNIIPVEEIPSATTTIKNSTQ